MANIKGIASDKRKNMFVFLVFFLLFAVFTRHRETSWNEASRLAAIQSLIEEGTLQIDNSIYVGTGDKIFYDGHFYSSKPPLLALSVAPIYFILYTLGFSFAEHPAIAYYVITLSTIGVISALGLMYFRMALREFTDASEAWADLVTLLTGTGTLILVYTSVLNNHTVTGALIFIAFYYVMRYSRDRQVQQIIFSGILFSLAGSFDLTCFLFIPFIGLIYLRYSFKTAMTFALSCVPVFIIYLLLNLTISGGIMPPRLNASLYDYPGSHFSSENLSGLAQSQGLAELAGYTFHVLVGNRGLFMHSPILAFAIIGLLCMYRERSFKLKIEYTILLAASLVFVGLALMQTTNYGGCCFGVRWLTTLMLVWCFPLAFMERWVRSARWRLVLFIVVACVSIAIALLGSTSPFTPCYVLPQPKLDVENTVLAAAYMVTMGPEIVKVTLLAKAVVLFELLSIATVRMIRRQGETSQVTG